METRRLHVWDGAKRIAAFSLYLALSLLLPTTALAGPPPVITAQPLDQGVALGGTATFTVTVTSGTALSYQWYKDGLLGFDTALAGQTSNTLTIANVGLLDPGTFYVVIRNAGGLTTSRHASLSLVLVNNPPVGNNDSYALVEDGSLSVSASGILANDTDADDNALTAVLVDNVVNGHLTLTANGSFTYIPNPDFYGTDSFSYRVSDGSTTGNLTTVTLTVTPVSDPAKITSQQMTATGFTLLISKKDPGPCVIWASTNLQHWVPISTNSSSGSTLVFTDSEASKYKARFYRVESR